MIVAFIGHAAVSSAERIEEAVKEQIRKHTAFAERVTCYLGGYGDFDRICARVCHALRGERPVETVYVTPYIGPAAQEKIREMMNCGLYDTVLYPPLENVPPKFAIAKRNEWMMTNADLIIAYVTHDWGGAYKFLQLAKRKQKKTVNISDLIP